LSNKNEDYEESSKLADTILNRFPGLILSYTPIFKKVIKFESKDTWIVNPSSISHTIQTQLKTWEKYSPETCVSFSSGTPVLGGKPYCYEYKSACESSGFSSRIPGTIFVKKLTADLEIIETQATSYDEAKLSFALLNDVTSYVGTDVISENLFNACATISSLGISFDSDTLSEVPPYTESPSWSSGYVSVATPEYFKEECIDKMLSPSEKEKLLTLSGRYPKNWPLSSWKKGFVEREGRCQKAALYFCKHTYSIKGTTILSYLTVGCETREVTANDARNDMRSLETEAQRLTHTYLVDTIEACDAAEKYGYYWPYRPAELSSECIKKKKEEELQKRKPKK
ncbi:MAG: hypothetical protein ACKVQV_13990, partial [Bacteroidia bacterium]